MSTPPLSIFVWTAADVIGLGFWAIVILVILCVGAWYGILSAYEWIKCKFRKP